MGNLSVVMAAALMAIILISTLWKKIFLDLIWRPYAITKSFRKQGVRGPPYKFYTGSLIELKNIIKAAGDLALDNHCHDITLRVLPHYRKWIKQYGSPLLFWVGAKPRICVTDPEMIKQILSNKFGSYIGIDHPSTFLALFGKGLLLVDGPDWARHRRIVGPAFAMDKLKLLVKDMAECATVMLEGWHNQTTRAGNQQTEIEVSQQLEQLTADVISRTAFGSSYMEGKKVFLAQKELQNLVAEGTFNIEVPGLRYLPTKRNLYKWKLEKIVRNKLVAIIQSRLDSKDHAYGSDLLGLMLEASKNEGSQMLSMDEIIDECKTFFFAGQDTTSHLLSWTMYLLSINQDWQEKLRVEVLQECGNNVPNADALSKLNLMNMVLLEALRLYGPVFFIGRKAGKDSTLGNIRIPKGTGLAIPVPIVHRIEEIWGADANEFNPARFENGVSGAAKHPNAMLAFSVGPRECIGKNFAMLEAKMVLAMILQRFTFSLSPSYKHAPTAWVTLKPQYGVPIVCKAFRA